MSELNEEKGAEAGNSAAWDDYFSRQVDPANAEAMKPVVAVSELVNRLLRENLPDCTPAQLVDGLILTAINAAETYAGSLTVAEKLFALAKCFAGQNAEEKAQAAAGTPTETATAILSSALVSMERAGFHPLVARNLMLAFASHCALKQDPKLAAELLYGYADMAVAKGMPKN